MMQTVKDNIAKVSSGNTKKQSKKPSPMLVTSTILAILLIVLGALWWLHAQGREETDDAYVEGHLTTISPRISGNVTKVLVEENQPVKTGQILVVLDPHDEQVQLNESAALLEAAQHQSAAAKSKIQQTALSALGETNQAQGDISSAEAEIKRAKAAVLQAQDAVIEAQAKLKEAVSQEEFARTDFERYKEVFANRAVTKQQYDKSAKSLEVAIAQREQAEQNLRQTKKQELQAESTVQETVGRLHKSKGMLTSAKATTVQKESDTAQYLSSLASINRYKAALEQSKLQLSYTTLYAPIDGRIGKRSVEVGQRVEPGQALLSLVQKKIWITANYKETQIGRMRVGQHVEIKIDAFPERTFKGTVDSLGPASGAKFSMLPPDNATGNFTKIVQRIPIRIVFDQDSIAGYENRIAPGMSCVVAVVVR